MCWYLAITGRKTNLATTFAVRVIILVTCVQCRVVCCITSILGTLFATCSWFKFKEIEILVQKILQYSMNFKFFPFYSFSANHFKFIVVNLIKKIQLRVPVMPHFWEANEKLQTSTQIPIHSTVLCKLIYSDLLCEKDHITSSCLTIIRTYVSLNHHWSMAKNFPCKIHTPENLQWTECVFHQDSI